MTSGAWWITKVRHLRDCHLMYVGTQRRTSNAEPPTPAASISKQERARQLLSDRGYVADLAPASQPAPLLSGAAALPPSFTQQTERPSTIDRALRGACLTSYWQVNNVS
jgi:hypothetical protein